MFGEFLTTEALQLVYRLTLAVLLGMVVGFEREYRRKSAGLRTYALVALGAALFTVMSSVSLIGEPSFDPSRIASQVVVGIGFIGAGIIFLREDKVEGLTTAAGLWATAAIGMSAGFGFYALAIYATFLVLLILLFLRKIEPHIPKFPR